MGSVRMLYVVYQDDVARPWQARREDTGLDLKSSVDLWIPAKGWAAVPTGVRLLTTGQGPVDIEVRGRSGLATKGVLAHHGTIDSGYRGEVKVVLFNFRDEDFKVSRGDRVAQLVIPPLDHLPYHPNGDDLSVVALDAITWTLISEEELEKALRDGTIEDPDDEAPGARGDKGFGSSGVN